MADWIISHFPAHQAYVEPFGGGASVLLSKSPAEVETYNDLDSDIVTFFRVLRDQPNDLVRAIDLTPFARDEFEQVWESADTDLEKARRVYVRSWQARGVGNSATESGWRRVSRPSRWQAPCREWDTTAHLYELANRLHGVQIEHDDALAVMQRYDDPKALTYLDPPYVPETLTGQRAESMYRHTVDHTELATAARSLHGYVVLSGYPCDLYARLYEDYGWVRRERLQQVNNPSTQRLEALWLSPRTITAIGPSQLDLFVA